MQRMISAAQQQVSINQVIDQRRSKHCLRKRCLPTWYHIGCETILAQTATFTSRNLLPCPVEQSLLHEALSGLSDRLDNLCPFDGHPPLALPVQASHHVDTHFVETPWRIAVALSFVPVTVPIDVILPALHCCIFFVEFHARPSVCMRNVPAERAPGLDGLTCVPGILRARALLRDRAKSGPADEFTDYRSSSLPSCALKVLKGCSSNVGTRMWPPSLMKAKVGPGGVRRNKITR